MATCGKCSAQIPDEVRFCPECGAPVEAPAAAAAVPPQQTYQAPPQPGYQAPPQPGYQAPPQQGYQAPPQPGYQAPPQQGYQAPPQQAYQQAAPADGYFNTQDVDAGKVFAILGYLFPILFFLPLVTGVKTAYGTFHANQALVLLIGYVIAAVLSAIIIGLLLYIVLFVLMILGLVSACNGSTKPMPIIGKIIILK